MSFKYCLALALLPCAALAAAPSPDATERGPTERGPAERGPTYRGPADVGARVAPASYASAFDGYRSTDAATSAPDQTWRAANTQVQHEGHAMPMDMPKPAAHGQQAETKADPHAGHAGHAGHQPPAAKADPHAGHAGHQPSAAKADPHAGHGGHP